MRLAIRRRRFLMKIRRIVCSVSGRGPEGWATHPGSDASLLRLDPYLIADVGWKILLRGSRLVDSRMIFLSGSDRYQNENSPSMALKRHAWAESPLGY